MRRVFKELGCRKVVAFGVAGLIFALCLSCFGLNQQDPKSDGANTGLAIQVTASRSLVKLPPPRVDLESLNCELTESEVRLHANATNPHKTEMNFTWQVPVGRLIGKGGEVTWDLSGAREGTYTATVDASDKHKHTASGSVTVTVVICPGWLPDPPPCPSVLVSCPSTVESKESVTFEAEVMGGDPEITYEWSLSAGKIITGQAKSKITVDVSGLRDESVTATLRLGGINPSCTATASCMVHVR